MVFKTILVTGGAGFIGSHTCVELLESGHEVVVVDDFSNSSPAALERVESIALRPLRATYGIDLRDRARLSEVFNAHAFDAVIHFAGKKSVSESVRIPLDYYDVNVGGTIALLECMSRSGTKGLVFSSSCSIYGESGATLMSESDPPRPTNPYARSKWMCEQIIGSECARRPGLHAISLRYFNPAGAHPSGQLGEDPSGVPGNILPFLAQLAVGRLERLEVFGGDYPTPDGSAIRDYVHVVDIAGGHRLALEHLQDQRGNRVVNLGSGIGSSVLEIKRAFELASGRSLPHIVVGRRSGDVARLVADATIAAAEWGWRTTLDVDDICRHAWNFQSSNPNGYRSAPTAEVGHR